MTLFLCFQRNMFAEMEPVSFVWLYLFFFIFIFIKSTNTHGKDCIYTA